MSLLSQLVAQGVVSKQKGQELEAEIAASGQKEEEIILEKGVVTEDFLFELKSKTLGIPLKKTVPDRIGKEVLALIPEESARYYKMVPLTKKENTLEVGMVSPEDLKAQEALKFLARQGRFKYNVFLIQPTILSNLLKQYKTLGTEVGEVLEKLEEEELVTKKVRPIPQIERLTEEAPISKVVAVILRHAVEGKASDIHIEPTKDNLRIRFRLLGRLYPSITLPLNIHPAVVARIKILSNLKIDESRIPQDGRFSSNIEGKDLDFRVSTFPTTLGEKVAIRVLDPSTGIKSFDQLGLIGRNLRLVNEASAKPYGLILSTGPTGSGKSTTLYAILKLLYKEGLNIVTLEDPVEYYMAGINQSQVRPEIGYDFAQGLRQILRQDPDIIMVGEIRDEETASLSIHSSLTGHVVLSTLHTNNAIGVVPRLVDMGIKPYLITPTLSVALAQRLVRRLCETCRKKVVPNKEMRNYILGEIGNFPEEAKKELKLDNEFSIYQPQGCKKCSETGFIGRIALFEVLKMTDELAELILKEVSEKHISDEARRQGMTTMKQDGIIKALQGLTTIEEVLRATEED